MRLDARSAVGAKACKQKLPPSKRKKQDSFGREDPIVGVPSVVVALPRVDVPLVAVPVHVHNEGTLVPEIFCITTLRILSGLNLIRGIETSWSRIPTDPCFLESGERTLASTVADTILTILSLKIPTPKP